MTRAKPRSAQASLRTMARGSRVGLVAGPAAVFAALVVACSEAPKLVGQGGACALTMDCDRGLACVPQQDGSRMCTGDLTSVAKATQPAPADAGADARRDGQADGASDASSDAPSADVVTPPPDAATD